MIEVLKQALEALELWLNHKLDEDTAWQAHTSLRQAIKELESQQAQQKQVNELHTCPYREEIHGDYESLCDCDEASTHQCAQDI